ncbi:hypothetical protein N0V93_002028 [Gnomoniopsis smithogilvyi]|uniref:Uncharacterized protein n=1 Tax=Gnomoniopsis smithogilvyi TaxID=1191159 RepID=A0A9W9D398_9PEZI|nr:hypothetical protein N0V93_002028 [Gnomoniopsis smithogilvyi]
MGSTDFESLHAELIGRVCEYLDEAHPASLLAFSQADKRCYAIASGLLFRTIKFTISNGQQLAQDVRKWETILSRESGFRHVRRLILHCATEDTKQRPEGYLSLDPCERHEDDSGLRSCWDLYNSYQFLYPNFSESSLMKHGWEAVVGLLKQCSGLADVFYACPVQFPPCLLHTLHANLPRCRLHDYTFHLNLDEEPIDPREMALATSPCLYSVGGLNLAAERVAWDLARYQAVRMKEAHVLLPGGEEIDLDEGDRDPRWAGGEMLARKPLETFHLIRPTFPETPLSFNTVSWAVHGNFFALRVLKLDLVVTNLDDLPGAKEFPALETLVFACARATRMEYWKTLLTFLHDLPRLTTLQIKDWARSVSFVPGLNSHLRYLDFSTHLHLFGETMKDDHIHQLADACPDLEELLIEIRRSRGSANEVSLYRALGRLRRLQNLTLRLDASPPGLDSTVEFFDPNGELISHGTTIEPWFDADDAKTVDGPLRPYRQGHIYDALVNSAIDPGLTRSIFDVINNAKIALGRAVLPLERLKVYASRGEMFQPAGRWSPRTPVLLPFLAALQSRWLVERDVRDDARDVLHVTELGRKSRLDHSSCQAKYLQDSRDEYLFKDLFDMWQRVWPCEEGASLPWESWKSLPLDLQVKDAAPEI